MKDLDYFKGKEKDYRAFLSDERYLVLRMDGKAFHSYTRGLQRPLDTALIDAMDATAKILCQEFDGAMFSYVQSDEITVVIDNKKNENTMPWLGAGIQKLVSISASICTAHFNRIRGEQGFGEKIAYFDSRVSTFNTFGEIKSYYNWRRDDAMKNSTSMAAESHFSHKELHGMSTSERREMLIAKGEPWENLDDGFRFGRMIYPIRQEELVSYTHSKTKETHTTIANRKVWICDPATTESLESFLAVM